MLLQHCFPRNQQVMQGVMINLTSILLKHVHLSKFSKLACIVTSYIELTCIYECKQGASKY